MEGFKRFLRLTVARSQGLPGFVCLAIKILVPADILECHGARIACGQLAGGCLPSEVNLLGIDDLAGLFSAYRDDIKNIIPLSVIFILKGIISLCGCDTRIIPFPKKLSQKGITILNSVHYSTKNMILVLGSRQSTLGFLCFQAESVCAISDSSDRGRSIA
jgi:hypothetical protein